MAAVNGQEANGSHVPHASLIMSLLLCTALCTEQGLGAHNPYGFQFQQYLSANEVSAPQGSLKLLKMETFTICRIFKKLP